MRNKKNIRTCLGCNKKIDKKLLYRIASIKNNNNKSNNSNNIIFDEEQNKGGRGSYVCSIDCLNKAIEKSFLQKRIRSKIKIEEISKIAERIKQSATRKK